MCNAIRRMCHHPDLKRAVNTFECATCLQHKLQGPGHGHLLPREGIMMPWQEAHVKLIGPWKVKLNLDDDDHVRMIGFLVLNCIDPVRVTDIVELIRVDNKSSEHVAQQFKNMWLSRHPGLLQCIHDKGGEFIGWEFQESLQKAHIQDAPIASKNPQANAICERMHQTVGNILRTLIHGNHLNLTDPKAVDNALATAMHVTRCAASRSLVLAVLRTTDRRTVPPGRA